MENLVIARSGRAPVTRKRAYAKDGAMVVFTTIWKDVLLNSPVGRENASERLKQALDRTRSEEIQ